MVQRVQFSFYLMQIVVRHFCQKQSEPSCRALIFHDEFFHHFCLYTLVGLILPDVFFHPFCHVYISLMLDVLILPYVFFHLSYLQHIYSTLDVACQTLFYAYVQVFRNGGVVVPYLFLPSIAHIHVYLFYGHELVALLMVVLVSLSSLVWAAILHHLVQGQL